MVLNGAVLAFCAATAFIDFQIGSYIAFGVMCFTAGVNATLILYGYLTPGLFRTYGEVERAVMRAQIEKDLNAAMAEIKKQHPEIENIQVQRVQ